MKQKSENKRKKMILSILSLLAILAVAVSITVAWLINQRSLKTAASLISPYTLRIGAGSNESIEQLDMGNIDVSSTQKYKDYVFCVYGNPSVPYVVQLAHTTNIGFQYTVYYAKEIKGTGSTGDIVAEYKDMKNDSHYFLAVPGERVRATNDRDLILMNDDDYINNNSGVANDTLKIKKSNGDEVMKGSYDNEDHVQKNAVALYMQSETVYPTNDENIQGDFIHYYILRVSWDANVQNDKETDIVYITVSAK